MNRWVWKFISCLEWRFIRKMCIFIIKENTPVIINSWPSLTLTMYTTPSKVLYLHGFTVKRIVNVTWLEMRYKFLSLFGLRRKQGWAAGLTLPSFSLFEVQIRHIGGPVLRSISLTNSLFQSWLGDSTDRSILGSHVWKMTEPADLECSITDYYTRRK